MAAFADDVLFYITKPRITIPNLLAIIKNFSELSNYKINIEKSETLKININKQEGVRLREVFRFPWRDKIKYLGVSLAGSIGKIFQINFIPFLDEIRAEIKRISNHPVSWIGRVNIVKMVLAPKVLYKIQMLPIPLLQFFFRTLIGLISRYVWKNKKPRISNTVLRREKALGGLGFLDFRNDHKAIVLARALHWAKGSVNKRWVNLEISLSNARLNHIIWNTPNTEI